MTRANFINRLKNHYLVAQWVRALAPQAEGWLFESQTDLKKS